MNSEDWQSSLEDSLEHEKPHVPAHCNKLSQRALHIRASHRQKGSITTKQLTFTRCSHSLI